MNLPFHSQGHTPNLMGILILLVSVANFFKCVSVFCHKQSFHKYQVVKKVQYFRLNTNYLTIRKVMPTR